MLHRTIMPATYLDGAGIGIEASRLHAAFEILNVVSNVDELRLHECQLILQALHAVKRLKRRLINLQAKKEEIRDETALTGKVGTRP